MYNKNNYYHEDSELKQKYNQSKEIFLHNQKKNKFFKNRYKIFQNQKNPSQKINHLHNIKNEYLKSKIIFFLNQKEKIDDLKKNIINLKKSNDILSQHESIINIRKLIISNQINFQILLDQEILYYFFEFAYNINQPHLQLESIICLSYLCNNKFLIVEKMINKGIFEIFFKNCCSSFLDIQKESLIGLLNLSKIDYIKTRFFEQQNLLFLEKLYISAKDQNVKDTFLFIFANLVQKYEFEDYNEQMRPFFIVIVENFIITSNYELMKEIITSISLSLFPVLIKYITNSEFLNKLKRFYLFLIKDYNKNSKNIIDILEILKIISKTLKVSNIQFLIHHNFLQIFTDTIDHLNTCSKQLICYILSNMLLGTEEHIIKIITQKNLFKKIILLLYSKVSKTASFALLVITNFCKSKNYVVISFVINDLKVLNLFKIILENKPSKESLLDIFDAVIELFYFFKGENKLREFKKKIIDDGFGFELEKYQYYEDDFVYAKCLFIFDMFFEFERELI